jgi:hypothetical protein
MRPSINVEIGLLPLAEKYGSTSGFTLLENKAKSNPLKLFWDGLRHYSAEFASETSPEMPKLKRLALGVAGNGTAVLIGDGALILSLARGTAERQKLE